MDKFRISPCLGISIILGLLLFSFGWDIQAEDQALKKDGFNKEVSPGEDFFEFVNGKWVEETEIPSDKTRWGSFVILAEKSREDVLAIIQEVTQSENLKKGSEAQKIRDLYRSYLDRESLNKQGISPIRPALDEIKALKNKRMLAAYWAKTNREGISSPFQFWISQDAKDTTKYVVYFTQSGIGLPDRDFYLDDSERSQKIQEAYQTYLSKILEEAGFKNATKRAMNVYYLEKRIAEVQWSRVESRDRIKTYNKYKKSRLKELTKKFDWQAFLKGTGIQKESEFIMRQPSFYEGMTKVIEDIPLNIWKDYCRVQLISSAAPYLNDTFFNIHFNFFSKALSGQQEPEPIPKRATSLINGILGEMVGKIYVEKHFPPAAKSRMLELVGNLKKAMNESINNLDWMDEETKTKALEKLGKFTTKIGYPDEWKDYTKLSIKPGDLIGNIRRASAFMHETEVGKLGGPIDRNEWFMTPQTVNAYYNPQMNEIVFPAAILQPPFFNLEADDAVNYGAIGMVIGHEIGHGFDDQGRKSNGDGNLTDWWSQESASKYDLRAQQLVEQYNSYEPVNGFKVNGQLTLGENIGDLGGLTLAWKAYQTSLADKKPDSIGGWTHEQRFFISYAQIWRIKSTTELMIRRLKTDTHSPAKFRVNGPLRNFKPFYDVFGLKDTQAMWMDEDERVSIW